MLAAKELADKAEIELYTTLAELFKQATGKSLPIGVCK